MLDIIFSQIYRRFVLSGIVLVVVLITGTTGYWLIGDGQYSLLDCLYMTVITIFSIGYAEIIDMSDRPEGRIFTIFIALSGISTLTYILTNFAAFLVEEELKETFWRKKMEKNAKKLKGHYIVCGLGGVGLNIIDELYATKRPYLVVDTDRKKAERLMEAYENQIFVEGDATDNSTLLKAGLKDAKGVFAVTSDDNQNLVISLTVKQMNPDVRVIARCHDPKNIEKMKKAGADSVVSPAYIGGLRMASEMIRPTVVSFLDIMLRDKEKSFRIEEIAVPESFAGRPVEALNIRRHPNMLLLAVKAKDQWAYNPSEDLVLRPDDILIFMTTPDERVSLGKLFEAG